MILPPGWELQEKLGQGGTAVVYKACHKTTGQVAACKIAIPDQQTDINFPRLADREKYLLRYLTFPGIVKPIPNQPEHTDSILLELCPGATLEKNTFIPDLQKLVSLLSAIAASLEFIHSNGIIHADIKPDNIFLPSDWDSIQPDSRYLVKLSDFSLGRFTNESETARAGIGTVGYMAPEILNDNITSTASDIFAFGVTAYQLLSGRHPFMHTESDPVKIQSIICEETPEPVRNLNPDCPEELNQLVMAMLAKQASHRPSNAWQILRTLEQIGSPYPYKNSLNPKWFVKTDLSYEQILTDIFGDNKQWTETLQQITADNSHSLRILLTGNYIRGNLAYTDKQSFEFKHRPRIPGRLRHQWHTHWNTFSLSQKKQLITIAVEEPSTEYDQTLPLTALKILEQFLRTSTIKRISASSAKIAYDNEKYDQAARLFTKAGDLQNAEQSAYQAATQLHKDNCSEDALALLRYVIRYAELNNKHFDVRTLIMQRADILKQRGESEKAEALYYQLIAIYKNKPKDMLLAETYKDLGDLYKMKQEFDKGIEVLQKALAIYEQLDNQLEISHTYNNMGNMYTIANDLTKALSNYRKALRIQHKLNETEDIASSLNNIGPLYAMKGRFNRAKRIFLLSIKLKKQSGNQMELARSLNNLGFLNYIIGENEESVQNLQEALEINRKIGSQKEILFNLENLTVIMIRAGKLNESSKFLKEGISLAQKLNDQPHIANFEVNTGKIMARTGNIKQAIIHFENAGNILQSINDKVLQVQLFTEQIYLYGQLGDFDTVTSLYRKAEPVAQTLNDRYIYLDLMFSYYPYCTHGLLDAAIKDILEKIGQKREKELFEFYKLHDTPNDITFDAFLKYLDTIREDLESPWAKYTLADKFKKSDINKALTLSREALNESITSNQIFMQIDLLIQQGDLHNELGNLEESYSKYQQALQHVKKISETISDKTLLDAFQRSQRLSRLILSIKNFKQKVRF